MVSDDTPVQKGLSRRKILAYSAVGVPVSALAGCTGGESEETPTQEPTETTAQQGQDGEGEQTETTTTPSEEKVALEEYENWDQYRLTDRIRDQELVYGREAKNPTERHWNTYNPKNNMGSANRLFVSLAELSGNLKDFVRVGAKDWTFSGKDVTIELFEDHTWSPGGQAVTTEDLRTKFIAEKMIDAKLWDFVEEIRTPDDKTFEITLRSANTNTDVFKNYIFSSSFRINTPRFVYNKFIEQYQDASTDDERESASKNLLGFSWETENVAGCGPFKAPPEVRESEVVFTRRDEGYPHLGKLNYKRHRNFHVPQGQKAWALLFEDKVDYAHSGTTSGFWNRAKNSNDVGTNVVPILLGWGCQLNLDYEKDWFNKREFRHAIAHALDFEREAKKHFSLVVGPEQLQTGVIGNCGTGKYAIEEFDGYDWVVYDQKRQSFTPHINLDNYTDHGATSQFDKAAEILEGIGFSKEDGKWYAPDGEVARIPFICGPDQPALGHTQAQSTSLKQFGFESTVKTMPWSKFGNRVNQGDYAATFGVWGQLSPVQYLDLKENWTYQNGPLAESPRKVEVPEYGNPDGDLIEIDIDKKLQQAANSRGEEYLKLVSELSWAFNQWLPIIQTSENRQTVGFRTDEWDWPSKKAAYWKVHHQAMAPLVGEPKAK